MGKGQMSKFMRKAERNGSIDPILPKLRNMKLDMTERFKGTDFGEELKRSTQETFNKAMGSISASPHPDIISVYKSAMKRCAAKRTDMLLVEAGRYLNSGVRSTDPRVVFLNQGVVDALYESYPRAYNRHYDMVMKQLGKMKPLNLLALAELHLEVGSVGQAKKIGFMSLNKTEDEEVKKRIEEFVSQF